MFREIPVLVLSLLTGATLFAAPALAGDAPTRSGPDSVGVDAMELPDVPRAVKLNCKARSADSIGAVHCSRRAGDDLDVRGWQLWNLQVRPVHGTRNLVAELGADAHGYVDTEVEVPAAYLYAVLALNGDGEVIARSRVSYVSLAEHHDRIEILRLQCEAHRTDDSVDDTTSRPEVQIGCGWSASTRPSAVGYVLWRSVNGGEREVIARTGLDVNSYRAADVAPGHRYLFVVNAVDAHEHVVGISRQGRRRGDRAQRAVDRLHDRVAVDDLDRVLEADRLALLRAALDELNPRYQRVLSLRYLANLDHDEAARAMGVTNSVMAVLVHRATAALTRTIARLDDSGVVNRDQG